jgi:hypothetical protein
LHLPRPLRQLPSDRSGVNGANDLMGLPRRAP